MFVRMTPAKLFVAAVTVSALVFSSPVIAQESDSATESAASSAASEIEQLSADSYANRQRATLEMWKIRDQSRDQVQRAARDPDPEVSGRAKWILRQWRRGSLPGTPPEVSRLLAKSSGAAGIDPLLAEGQFAAALVAVEESAGTLEFEAIQERIRVSLLRRFPECARAAIKYNRVNELLELIGAVAADPSMAVCRVQLMQEIGMDVDQEGLLPQSAENWNARDRFLAEILVLLSLGRTDQAMEVAEASQDAQLLYRCQAITGRWSDALDDATAAARAAEPGSITQLRHWSRVLICADRANDSSTFAEAAAVLAKSIDTLTENTPDLVWRTLASHGEIESAIAVLEKSDPESAANVALDASQVNRAFDALGFPLAEVDTKIIQWVDEALAAQREAAGDDPNQPVELVQPVNRMLALIRALINIGREDAAKVAAERMCRSDLQLGSVRLRDYVLSSLANTRRNDWVIDWAVLEGEKTVTPIVRSILANMLPAADSRALEIVFEALGTFERDPKLTTEERIRAACQLFMGEVPDRFDPHTDFKRIYEFAVAPTRPAAARQFRGRIAGRKLPVQFRQIRANLAMVELFTLHGQADHASSLLRKLVELGELDALLQLGEQELDTGSGKTASALFLALGESVARQTVGRIGNADSDLLTIKSLLGQWTIARRIGDQRQADDLLRQIRLALCTPSTRLRLQIAEYLVERGEQDLAEQVYERLLPMAMFNNEDRTQFYDVARGYALYIRQSNPSAAAKWYDLALSEMVATSNFRAGAFVSLPIYVRRWSIESAMQSRDVDAARGHIDRIMQLNPMDIDLAERILPKMRSMDADQDRFQALADEAFQQIVDHGITYCDQFSGDAMTANNLAWVAAMNDSHLDQALTLSERAVSLEPDSAIYRDTLAEILFRLDRKQEALLVEEACLLDDPTQWHLHQQVEKYRESVTQP